MKISFLRGPAALLAVVALLISGLMLYAGLQTAHWGVLLACIPAILATIGIVAAMVSGMFLFSKEENETPAEAARPDGEVLIDELRVRIGRLVHRVGSGLHVRGLGR